MRFAERQPGAALRPYVRRLWYYEGPELAHTRERVLPSGCMQLLVNLDEDALRWWDGPRFQRTNRIPGAGVGGVYERPFVIDTAGQRRVVGAVLCAGAAPSLLGAAADELAGSHTALEALWGRPGAQLRERLLEAASPPRILEHLEYVLCARLSAPTSHSPSDARVRFAVGALERGASVRAISEELGLGEKRLRQLFAAQVGVTPKRFARIARMQALLALAAASETPRWAALAAACGYYDQAHLIQEFRSLTGLTPSSYRARAPGEHNHVALPP
jgi:AraC-like DNA-binding protein